MAFPKKQKVAVHYNSVTGKLMVCPLSDATGKLMMGRLAYMDSITLTDVQFGYVVREWAQSDKSKQKKMLVTHIEGCITNNTPEGMFEPITQEAGDEAEFVDSQGVVITNSRAAQIIGTKIFAFR